MGEVYRARDAKLGRDVAVKVLPDRFASDVESRARFEREARAVAALSHPNILAIFDFGQEGGISFAVTELLEGETLRQRLGSGALSPRKAADFAAQIGEGLAAAHARGVIHRDLKPENLFVTKDGYVKILDFGLALRTQAAGGGDEDLTVPVLTEPGAVLGTVGYMSPEQARGQPADVRSDIFSFGAVLYEMLCGSRPFRGDSPAETLTAILRDEPPEAPEEVRRDSPALERIARRCLEKDPEERFQLARDLAFAIEAASGTPGRQAPSAPARERGASRTRSVAVLFFKDLARDPENAHLGLGLADATITELSAVKSLLVRPTSAILRYRDRDVAPEEAGRELGVDAVVDGNFQRSGSRLRVTVQLVAASDGHSLWGTKIDASLDDVFRMQDEVSRRIVEALEVELSPADEKRLARAPLPSGRAYELYLKGRARLFSDKLEDMSLAIESFESALKEDPGFALARVGAGNAYARMGFAFDPEGGWLEKAETMCAEALAIEPRLPEGRYLKGLLAWTPRRGFDHVTAITEYMAAIAGRPNLTEAHERLSITLMHLSMLPEASSHTERALAIDPEDTLARVHRGLCAYLEGRFQDALEISLASERDRSPWANYQTAMCQLHLGDLEGAARNADLVARRFPEDPVSHSFRALIAARSGDAGAAREAIDQTLRRKRSFGHYHHTQYDVACTHALLGEKEAALDWLTDAARNGFPCYSFFEIDPLLGSLRGEPRFRTLMRELEEECDRYRRLYRELQSSSGRDSSQ
jgi:TolB-like protein